MMKKYVHNLFIIILAIVISASTKPTLGYTFVYQGSITDLANEMRDPTNWIYDGNSPTFSCGGGSDVTCSITTFIDCREFGENHLSCDADICLGNGQRVQFITLIYFPVLFDQELGNFDNNVTIK